MDIVKRLRNYTIILFLISIGSTASMVALEYQNLKLMYIDESLINTIIASFYAVTIAVFIYYKQLKDKASLNVESILSILNSVQKDFDDALKKK